MLEYVWYFNEYLYLVLENLFLVENNIYILVNDNITMKILYFEVAIYKCKFCIDEYICMYIYIYILLHLWAIYGPMAHDFFIFFLINIHYVNLNFIVSFTCRCFRSFVAT